MSCLADHDIHDDYCAYGPIPPPLCHQRSLHCGAVCCDTELDEPPIYRSLSISAAAASFAPPCLPLNRSLDFAPPDYRSLCGQDDFDESLLHRSVELSTVRLSISDSLVDGESSTDALPQPPPRRRVLSNSAAQTGQPSNLTELPVELFDLVLHHLSAHPDLFVTMRVCRSWHVAAQANYVRRMIRVPATPDALLHAVASASAGDTLTLDAGVHMLSKELIVDRPLKLQGPADADSASAVLCSVTHVVVRTRCASSIGQLTMCRLGDDVGYPNTVIFAEASRLSIDGCRITCGGGATSVPQALRAFDGAPCPGEPWTTGPPASSMSDSRVADDARQDRPQTGVWVGAAASVHMSRNIISCTMGPGIKIYRGTLEAEENTIAFSCRGANVVANGGKVLLLRNEIRGAVGDGISSWNNAQMRVERNRIHSNTGSGVAINSVGGEVSITDNYVFNNTKAAVLFVTSQAQQATLRGNMLLEQNGGGGVQGLRQNGSGKERASFMSRRPTQCTDDDETDVDDVVDDASNSMEM
uniref:F-box domain-containing protein n=1 Tax=Coccolithus braarudii TaxID=221442 RepID=A0A7S0PW31_9EUKA|mmetsp:Transcript_15204/g.33037  ORF Transcript_15204/g.33037 Transcript_15204/m.33037 type:complete len:528 (+) Transcript_15204:152-1735(+)|eukprot:CAMPEP_0183350898 /NCGR_PEP_ID=MMETSP0164_2-20130417/21728_1 /TAXON_ID=221442 /ORGANISM="Coccolithus pelagicus ssp braarudi, Strain PLY182g" /LENGTH=527 /DNA_ID=CAMNT_0025522923 /DNA_START=153 /DNA_END=1736 /DNA_ORIENTATION=+